MANPFAKPSSPFTKQPQSKPLSEVIKPPTTPLTPYIPKTTPTRPTGGGGGKSIGSPTGGGIEISPTGKVTTISPTTQPLSQVITPKTNILTQQMQQIQQQRISQPAQSIIYQKSTGVYKGIPTYQLRVKTEEGKDRLATREEADYFNKQGNFLQASTKKQIPVVSKAIRKYQEVKGKVSGRVGELKEEQPFITKTISTMITGPELKGYKFDESTGQFVPEKEFQRRETSREQSVKKVEGAIDYVMKNDPDFVRGTVKGILTYPIKEPEQLPLLLATGKTLPFLFKGGERLATGVFGGSKVAGRVVTGTIGGTVAGTYAGYKGVEISLAPTSEERGKVFGKTITEIGLLGSISEKPTIQLKKTIPEFNEKVYKKDVEARRLQKDAGIISKSQIPYQSLAQKFAKDDGAIVFDTKMDKGKIGRDLFKVEQAKANKPLTPAEVRIEPTLAQQTQLTRLKTGLDILEVGKGYVKIREAPRPDVLKFINAEPKPFEIISKPPVTRNEALRLSRGLDIIEYTGKVFKIREAPKPEVLKSLNVEPKPFEFTIKPSIERRDIVRLQKGLDILEVGKGYVKPREMPKPEVLKDFDTPFDTKILEVPKELRDITISKIKEREVYHGTIKSIAQEIKIKGLKEGSYVTPELERAKGYAGRKAIMSGKIEPTTLKLDIKESDIISIDKAMGIKVKAIPPERISIIEKPKPERLIKTIKDFTQEPIKGKPVSSGRQQLVQQLKEPELVKKVSYVRKRLEPIQFQEQKGIERKDLLLKTELEQIPKQKGKSLLLFAQTDKQLTKESQILKQPQKSMQKLIQEEAIAQPSKQTSRQLYAEPQIFKQPQRFAQPQLTRQRYKYKEPQMLREEFIQIRKKKKGKLPSLGKKYKESDLGLGTGYDVFKIRRGKKTILARGLYKSSALDIGTKSTLSDLSATFGISKSDLPARDVGTGREFDIYGAKFRRPTARSRLRKFGGDIYVQKQTGRGGRLFSSGELKEIKQSKMKKLMGAIA